MYDADCLEMETPVTLLLESHLAAHHTSLSCLLVGELLLVDATEDSNSFYYQTDIVSSLVAEFNATIPRTKSPGGVSSPVGYNMVSSSNWQARSGYEKF